MKVVHPGKGCEAVVATPNRTPLEPWMNVHKNARLTPQGRLLMNRRISEQGWTVAAAAEAGGLSVRRAYHWLARYRAGGERMLHDRSSAPARCRDRVAAERVGEIERPRRGELIHIDTKKLGRIDGIGHRITGDRTGQSNKRGTGWEALHVCIDDASRLAYSEILPDEKTASALGFLDRALSWLKRHGVTVERVMTDNGSAYRSHAFRQACAYASLRHLRPRPYTPRTNGKAERFIQTSLREWAYARPYHTSAERTAVLEPWITDYNTRRSHSAIGHQPPFQRLNNLLGNDI